MSEKKKYSIKTDFTTLAITLIPIGAAVNIVGGYIKDALGLPLYLNTIGTIFSGMLCGPWVAAVTGVMTNVVRGCTGHPNNFFFIPVNIVVGMIVGFCARANMFDKWWKTVLSMLIMSLASIVTSAPITVLVFGGVTGNTNSVMTAALMATGANIWTAVMGTTGVFTFIDRIISYILGWLVIRAIPSRTLVRFSCGSNYLPQKK